MAIYTIWFESRDKILLVLAKAEIMTSWLYFPKNIILSKSGAATFSYTITIARTFMVAEMLQKYIFIFSIIFI